MAKILMWVKLNVYAGRIWSVFRMFPTPNVDCKTRF